MSSARLMPSSQGVDNSHCRVDAGKVELDGAQYAGLSLPFTITQLIWIEVILVGGAEIYRNRELDPERRLYPGKQLCSMNAYMAYVAGAQQQWLLSERALRGARAVLQQDYHSQLNLHP